MTSPIATAILFGRHIYKINNICESMKVGMKIIQKVIKQKLTIKKRVFNKYWLSSRSVFGITPRQLYTLFCALTSNSLVRVTRIESQLFNETIRSQN
jgi:hypothetical protein